MHRGDDGGGSTCSRRYPCSAKCVISLNFKHGCFEKVCASHLNVSPDITFIQFASQLRASMVSSHIRTPTAANRSAWDSQQQNVLLRSCQILSHFSQDMSKWLLGKDRTSVRQFFACFILLNLDQWSFMKQGWSRKMLPLLVQYLHWDSRWPAIVRGVLSFPRKKRKTFR